jgi:hypothetical protein
MRPTEPAVRGLVIGLCNQLFTLSKAVANHVSCVWLTTATARLGNEEVQLKGRVWCWIAHCGLYTTFITFFIAEFMFLEVLTPSSLL